VEVTLANSDPDGQSFETADRAGMELYFVVMVDFPGRKSAQCFLQCDPRLQSSQGRADAEVNTVPERNVRIQAPSNVISVRIDIFPLVAAGRSGEE
jgi:hypothetical protein